MTQNPKKNETKDKRRMLTLVRQQGWTEDRRTIFLAELAAMSNVSAAARAAQMSTQSAYKLRRKDKEFNRDWRLALAAGYEELEMEMLHRARFGVDKPVYYQGEKVGCIREYSDATGMRILLAYKEQVAATRAQEQDGDEPDIRERLDQKLREMRERLSARAEARDTAKADAH